MTLSGLPRATGFEWKMSPRTKVTSWFGGLASGSTFWTVLTLRTLSIASLASLIAFGSSGEMPKPPSSSSQSAPNVAGSAGSLGSGGGTNSRRCLGTGLSASRLP